MNKLERAGQWGVVVSVLETALAFSTHARKQAVEDAAGRLLAPPSQQSVALIREQLTTALRHLPSADSE